MKRNHKKTGALRWQWRRAHCLVADSSELFKFLLTLSCLSTCACSYHSPSNSLALANIQDEGLINHQTISQSDHQVQERAHTVRAISQQDGADHLSFEPNSSILSSTNMNFKHNLPMHQAPKGYRRLANLSNRTSALRTSSGTLPHSLLLPLSLATQSTTTSTAIPMTQHQQQQQAIRHHEQQVSNQSQKAGLLEKICMGTSNKLSSQHNKSDHYQNLYERYKDCTYVIGNLEITWLDRTSGGNHQEELDLSFLESIREITGYLLIAHVNVTRIRLPNLLIIRGRDLFKSYALNEKEEFALILIENELESLELPNLAEIQAGSMGSYDNRNLCRIRTIDWEDILAKTYKSIFVYNGAQPECPPCDPACMGHCWGEGPEMCQKLSKSTCAHACGGRCFGATSSDCCHQFCAAGCTGPSQTDCLACKNFYDNGSCVQECTSLERYNPSKFEWEPNPDGKYTFGATCTKECPQNMLRDNGACVRVCPPNKRSKNGECVVCAGPCPKKCQGVEVVHSGNIDQLINCTVIDGSITILDESFTGGYFGQLETGPLSQVGPQSQAQPPKQQQQQQLQQQQQQQQSSGLVINQNSSGTVGPSLWHKPMHPSRLEVFKTLREITDYLIIKAKHPDFKDLSYFTNLRAINGGRTTDMLQALSITRTSLVSLNLRSLFHIPKGKITIEDNPELCFADTIDWKQLNISRPEDVTIRNNAESSKCRAATLQCHEQCARDGCWGPGPDECLSCNNYKLDEYCVVNCSSTESLGFLSYEESVGARICKRCHPECSQGCHGTEARHCEACRSVKDGPYCVPECPSHKYNSNGTCLECDKGCGPDGCSGPSSKLGEGGCNSCAKAIIRSHHHDPALAPLDRVSSDGLSFDIECIRAEEPCPDGYYQEYVVGASQPEGSPLKSSSGRPVCRKCHHRCKRCIGMGTHKTVCECAKYVAGEQCEDHCPRDYYADENSRQCVKCSPECNGCFGPTEADCISCRVYRIYYDTGPPTSSNQLHNNQQIGGPMLLADLAANGGGGGGGGGQQRLRFNCTAQCPSDKPHRISERNMLDPYCSDDPGIDIDSPSVTAFSSTTILFMFIISSALMVCISIHRCQIERDKTYKMTMRLSGMDEEEELTPSNEKPNLATLRSIQESELSEGKVLGSGFGGTVHQGFWRRPELNGSIPVAIKKLHDNGQSNIHKEFLEEAYIMASVRHPNLVSLLGVCMTPKDLMLVTPLMPLGCLLDYVKTKENQASITSKMMFEYGNQIAKGMKYLEQRRMVHRDLALRNVLLQTRSRALISDFGLAKFLEIDQSEYHSGGGRLPIKWLAPECIRERKFTHKSDVWAFGVTIWELVTYGQRPFEEYETRDVPLAIEKGARLQQPNHVSAELYKVMYACWFYTPEDRPSFEQLVESFTTFARDPGRYLICGPKVIELCKGLSVLRHLDDDEVNDDRCNDQYDMDDDGDCDESPSEEASPTSLASSQPPLGAAMPNLTPSTHNRLNEMFGFELQRHRASESSDINGPSSSLTTPILKKIGMFSSGSRQLSQSGNHHQHAHHHHHHHQHPHLSSSNLKGSLITTDANNNTFVTNTNNGNANNGCWSMHHTVSSNSLGQRSEQPTDMYDYLLPSPSTNEHGHTFSTFYTNSYDNSDSLSVRNPPHSAGVVSNITNEEYFLTRENYVNDSLQGRSLSTSNGNIPQSLV